MIEVHDLNSNLPLSAAVCEPLGDELFRLTLTKENKAEIFEHGLNRLNDGQHEASAILDVLEKWDPHTRSLFALRSSSTIIDTPFRLVYLKADKASFDETGFYVRQYMAVSYCWQSEDFLSDGYKRHNSWHIHRTSRESSTTT